MRLNELLGIMRRKLADGELAYDALFASFPLDEPAAMNHKDLQWRLAEQMLGSLTTGHTICAASESFLPALV